MGCQQRGMAREQVSRGNWFHVFYAVRYPSLDNWETGITLVILQKSIQACLITVLALSPVLLPLYQEVGRGLTEMHSVKQAHICDIRKSATCIIIKHPPHIA